MLRHPAGRRQAGFRGGQRAHANLTRGAAAAIRVARGPSLRKPPSSGRSGPAAQVDATGADS